MEIIENMSFSDDSNYSDSEDDEWIPQSANQLEEISDVDFNGMLKNLSVKFPINYI